MIETEYEERDIKGKLSLISAELVSRSENLQALFYEFLNLDDLRGLLEAHVCMLDLIADNLYAHANRIDLLIKEMEEMA